MRALRNKMPKCGGQLKQMRLAAKFSQNGFARAADLDRTTIRNAEEGVEVSELTVSKIACALSEGLGKEVTMDQILK